MVFRRRSREVVAEVAGDRPRDSSEQAPGQQAEAQRSGPWDEGDLQDPRTGRVDFGGLLVPAVAGMQVRVDTQDNRITAINVIFPESTLQVMPFAAPRSGGIWDEVRAELAASVAKQGGTVDEASGPLGAELRARMPVRSTDGLRGTQHVRFIGTDGPRWFLRGVIRGKAGLDAQSAGPIERIFKEIVVVRGGEPMAPRDPIPLRLPRAAGPAEGADAAAAEADPFERGPEITEVR